MLLTDLHWSIHGAYRTLKVVFHDLQGSFMSIFHDFSRLSSSGYQTSQTYIIRLQSPARRSGGALKLLQQVWRSPIVRWVFVCMGQKWLIFMTWFSWLSITFQDLGLMPWLSKPGKFKFQIPQLCRICMHPINRYLMVWLRHQKSQITIRGRGFVSYTAIYCQVTTTNNNSNNTKVNN